MAPHDLMSQQANSTALDLDARLALRSSVEQQSLAYADSLSSSPAKIRLLHLQPGPSDSPIIASLQTLTLSSAQNYEALSYTWGAATPTHPISVDDARCEITANLKLALFRLRHPEKVRVLWIDGICINQNDLAEKSFQVGLMRDIYSRAANTVVWLGEEGNESDAALSLCERMANGWGNGFVKELVGIDIEAAYEKFKDENGTEEENDGAAMEEFASAFDLEEQVYQRFQQVGYDAAFGSGYEGPYKGKVDAEIRKALATSTTTEEEEVLAMIHAGTMVAHFEAIGDRVARGEMYDGLYEGIIKKAVVEERSSLIRGTNEAVKERNAKIREQVEEKLLEVMMTNGTLQDFFKDAGRRVALGEEWNGPFRELVYEAHAEGMAELEAERREAEAEAASKDKGKAKEIINDAAVMQPPSTNIAAAERPFVPTVGLAKEGFKPRSYESFVLQILRARKTAVSSEDLPTNDEIRALHAVFRRPWFRRIWIVQEAGVSEVISIQCGAINIDWRTFYFGFMISQKLNRMALLGPAYYRNLVSMSATRQSLLLVLRGSQDLQADIAGLDSSLDLLQLLVRYRRYLATNQRDKVYALLGIAQMRSGSLGVAIDYKQGLATMYTSVAKCLLQNAANLDIFAVPKGHGEVATDLPSWVPDWSDTTRMVYPLAGNHEAANSEQATEPLRVFTASGSSKANAKVSSGNTIDLRGILFDNITEIAPVFHVPESNLDILNPANAGQGTPNDVALAFLKELFAMFRSLPRIMKEWQFLAKCDYEPMSSFAGSSKAAIFARSAWQKVAKIGSRKYQYPTGEDNFTVFARTVWADMETPADSVSEVRKYMAKMKDMERLVHSLPSFDFEPTDENVARFMKKMAPLQKKIQDVDFMKGDVGCVHVLERRLARSGKGYLCLVPAETNIGDHIVVLQGGATPFVVRSVADGRKLVGECYVHGIMYGEAWDEEACGDVTLV